MKSLTIYLQCVPQPLKVACNGVCLKDGEIALVGASELASEFTLLIDHIVAVAGDPVLAGTKTLLYSVYLKGKPEPLSIRATGWRLQGDIIRFFNQVGSTDVMLDDVYVKVSAVLAIIPSVTLIS
jgi:hypothetical protein